MKKELNPTTSTDQNYPVLSGTTPVLQPGEAPVPCHPSIVSGALGKALSFVLGLVVMGLLVIMARTYDAPKAEAAAPVAPRSKQVNVVTLFDCQYLTVGDSGFLTHMPQCSNCVARAKIQGKSQLTLEHIDPSWLDASGPRAMVQPLNRLSAEDSKRIEHELELNRRNSAP